MQLTPIISIYLHVQVTEIQHRAKCDYLSHLIGCRKSKSYARSFSERLKQPAGIDLRAGLFHFEC